MRKLPVRQRFLVPLMLITGTAAADGVGTSTPDLAREQRMANQIVDAILDGETLWIDGAGGRAFLAILTESTARPVHGTVILLHGRGLHPDWTNVVHPLRTGLTGRGWNTLSIQLPVLASDATYYDYLGVFGDAMPRIEAAIARARSLSAGKVVLLAHSCGAHMAQHWMLRRGADARRRFDAFVGIGMGATDAGQPMREPFALAQLTVPVLDVYAEEDYNAVRRLAPERRDAIARGGHPLSAQVVVADAEHYFVDRGDALLDVVADWLDTLQPPR